MKLYCDLCSERFDTDKMVSVHCGSYICNGCILSEAAKLKEQERSWSEMVVHAITKELVDLGAELPETNGEGLEPEQFVMIIRSLVKG